ncbi:MAG: hypothetical protein WDO69_29320 [Pseudomonadota bacterium]
MAGEDPLHGEDEGERADQGGGLQAELLRSYLAFARRGIRQRRSWVAGILLIGFALTGLLVRYLPRTYRCTTVLMTVDNPVLDGNGGPNPLLGAPTVIMRQANLESLVRETGLIQKFAQRRPPLMALKDRLTQRVFGPWSDATISSILVGTLGSKLVAGPDAANNLQISVDWTDGKTAAELAEAAREGFLRTRHTAEISAFEAKMAILDEHAIKMRAEVETLAQQINTAHTERAEHAVKSATIPGSQGNAVSAAPRRAAAALAMGTELPEQRAKLVELKRQLAEREGERDRQLRDERTKLAELQLHLTPSHPQVVTEQERIALLSQVPSDIALMRSEVADLEGTLKQREALATHSSGGGSGGPATGASAVAAALPSEIIQALENENTDPALTAQLSGAVVRYGSLRDEIRSGRMQLDTAQAAFEHRYQIVVPAEVPDVPTKPKPGIVLAAGVFLSLLLALGVPVLAELRRGVIVERWQVEHMALPVLAELKLPPHSAE